MIIGYLDPWGFLHCSYYSGLSGINPVNSLPSPFGTFLETLIGKRSIYSSSGVHLPGILVLCKADASYNTSSEYRCASPLISKFAVQLRFRSVSTLQQIGTNLFRHASMSTQKKYDVHTALRHIYKLVPPQANSNMLRMQNTMPVQCQMFRSPARAES